MGTTKASGWAVFWFMAGFTIIGTAPIGTGIVGLLVGFGIMGWACVQFRAIRPVEEQ